MLMSCACKKVSHPSLVLVGLILAARKSLFKWSGQLKSSGMTLLKQDISREAAYFHTQKQPVHQYVGKIY